MLQGYLEAMRGDQVFDRLCRLLDGVSSLGQSAVEVGKFPANCVRNLGVRKPGNIVKISGDSRSEEHTSELQSRGHLVCRLLLEKKNGSIIIDPRNNI